MITVNTWLFNQACIGRKSTMLEVVKKIAPKVRELSSVLEPAKRVELLTVYTANLDRNHNGGQYRT
jgi:hypothetical protein